MRDKFFEWDDLKAASNWRDHGITFEMARDVFKDMFAVEWTDREHSAAEERFGIPGMVENRLLFVSYALRRERVRIIPAKVG